MQIRSTLIVVVLIVGAAVIGRITAPNKVVTETKTVYVDKKTDDKNIKDNKKIIIVHKPDGTAITIITDDKDIQDHKTENSSQLSESTKEISHKNSKISISALGAINATNPFSSPLLGVSLNKEILGPITVGIFGLSNGIGGISLGINL